MCFSDHLLFICSNNGLDECGLLLAALEKYLYLYSWLCEDAASTCELGLSGLSGWFFEH